MAALLLAAVVLSGCPARKDQLTGPATAEERNAAIVAIADRFSATDDLEAAQEGLNALNLPAASQAVLALAESFIAQDKDTETTLELVNLASGLGLSSRMTGDFVAVAAASGAAVPVALAPPATNTPVPTATATPEPTATSTETPAPTDVPQPTDTPTETPVPRPVVVVDSQMNVRSGPGTGYAVLDQVQAGDELDILARSQDSKWWQVTLPNGGEGWLAASLVTANGPTDGVQIAQNVAPPPTPRPQPTAAPVVVQPTQPPPPPQSSSPYVMTSFRLRPIGQDAQHCTGGDHNIFVTVVDSGGNPIDGVRVRETYTGQIYVTGDQGKGPGRVQYDIYRGGGGVVEIIDGNNNPISGQSPGMSADWPPFDLMLAAGYCNCKPHPDPDSCRADLESKQYLFTVGHYVYEVTFQRQ